MSFKIESIPFFDKQVKKLAKKYRSIKDDLAELIESLEKNPKQGIELKNNCYKIRMAIKSKGKGKSGGARLVTHIHIDNDTLYLLTIFDKSDKDNISDNEIAALLKDIE